MGIVYLARNVILERPVAIKPLATAIAARGDVQRRFLREACIAAQCFHPNIVPIRGVEESGELASSSWLMCRPKRWPIDCAGHGRSRERDSPCRS